MPDQGDYVLATKWNDEAEGGGQTITNCNGFKLPAADGKMRSTDCATMETLLHPTNPAPIFHPLTNKSRIMSEKERSHAYYIYADLLRKHRIAFRDEKLEVRERIYATIELMEELYPEAVERFNKDYPVPSPSDHGDESKS